MDAKHSGIHGFLGTVQEKTWFCFQQTKSIKITFHQISIPFIQHSTVSSPWRQACWQIIGTSPSVRWCGIFISNLWNLSSVKSPSFLDESRDSIQFPPKTTFETSPIVTGKIYHQNRYRMVQRPQGLLPTGRIGCAESSDGLKWRRCKGPLEVDPFSTWKIGGSEDNKNWVLFFWRCSCWEWQKWYIDQKNMLTSPLTLGMLLLSID